MSQETAKIETELFETELYFLGVSRMQRPGWEQLVAEPMAPKNYGSEAAAKDIAKKRQAQAERAYRQPVTGYVDSLVILGRHGERIIEAACPEGDTMTASRQLVSFINAYPGAVPRLRTEHSNDVGTRWFGFDIRDNLGMIALEALRAGESVPPCMWLYRPFQAAPFADPYEMAVQSSLRGDVDLHALCEFLGIEVPVDLVTNPVSSADLARRLTLATQLTP